MKWRTMSPRDRRAVLLGIGILLPGLLYIWAVRPYMTALSDVRDQLATERATLARERAAIATARRNPQLQHIADSAMRAMRPRLFEGKDDVMASAELASYLGDVARKTRVWLQTANTRPAVSEADGVRTLRVEIRAESDLRGVLTFLQALERGDKLVRVDRLDISRTPRSNDSDEETLSVAATLAGFAVGDSVTTASTSVPAVATAQMNAGSAP
jgi:Type II secretion system (T2SS), protein M subtype b